MFSGCFTWLSSSAKKLIGELNDEISESDLRWGMFYSFPAVVKGLILEDPSVQIARSTYTQPR